LFFLGHSWRSYPVLQKEFLENIMEPLILAAKRGEIVLYDIDAAHFVMGAFPGYLWSKVRVFIRTPSGRNQPLPPSKNMKTA